MSARLSSPEITALFGRACRLVGAQRRGLILADLAGAHAIARELESERPDRKRVDELAAELGIEVAALEEPSRPRRQYLGQQLELAVVGQP